MSASLLALQLLMQLAITTPPTPAHQRENVTITEVEFQAVTGTNQSVWLSVDPGYVSVMFFSAATLATYEVGLGRKVTPVKIKLADLTKVHGKYFDLTSASSTISIPKSGVVLRTRDGEWFEIEDLARTNKVRVYYRDPSDSSNLGYNMELDATTDVVFWNVVDRSIYREGMLESGLPLNPLRFANIRGIYPRGKYPSFTGVLFMPTVGRAGKYHSEAGEICYHFESCQWSCIAK
jgi:hypothetical protein